MNPILILIYHFLKRTTKTVFGVFFLKTTIINKDSLKIDNATILVSNHPNTLFDPLNVAARVDKTVHFLANAGLLEAPVLGSVLNKLYCIPIERQKDVNGRGIRNNKSFDRCDNFLTNGGCLYIAPEGISIMEKQLRSLKTGTARIALRAEAKNNFQLGLTIVPFGLTYSAPTDFRSEVLINIGPPLRVADYQSLFEDDNFKAARKLTEDLQEILGNLIYNTHSDDEEQFLNKIETIINNEHPEETTKQFFRAKEYIKLTRNLKNEDPKGYNQLIQDLNHYFAELETLKINDKAIAATQKKQNWISTILLLVLGFPFFIFGYINNFLAFYTPAFLAKKLNLYVGYTSTVKGLSGIFIVPFFYGLQIWLFQSWFDNSTMTILYALILLPTGWIAWEYLAFIKQYAKNSRAFRFWKKGEKRILNLVEKRKNILESLTSISTLVKL
jgi:1-acyl-sn-glycerol-3-phosphate acyltransferase